jgi:hypothetical protein
MKLDYVHFTYSTESSCRCLRRMRPKCTCPKPIKETTKAWPKPRWQIINEAIRDLKGLFLPMRFIELSGNSWDFARL